MLLITQYETNQTLIFAILFGYFSAN